MKRAVVLLSGGIDSTTTLAIAIAEGYEAYALSFEYRQRHHIETEAARRVADSLGAKEHRVANIDLRVFGGSALTDHVDVPKKRSQTEIAHGIPVTYVPARNTIFLAYALAWSEVVPANDIFLNKSRRRRQTLSHSHAANQILQSRNHPQSSRARCRSFPHAQLL